MGSSFWRLHSWLRWHPVLLSPGDLLLPGWRPAMALISSLRTKRHGMMLTASVSCMGVTSCRLTAWQKTFACLNMHMQRVCLLIGIGTALMTTWQKEFGSSTTVSSSCGLHIGHPMTLMAELARTAEQLG